jgi:hypothetical protein
VQRPGRVNVSALFIAVTRPAEPSPLGWAKGCRASGPETGSCPGTILHLSLVSRPRDDRAPELTNQVGSPWPNRSLTSGSARQRCRSDSSGSCGPPTSTGRTREIAAGDLEIWSVRWPSARILPASSWSRSSHSGWSPMRPRPSGSARALGRGRR